MGRAGRVGRAGLAGIVGLLALGVLSGLPGVLAAQEPSFRSGSSELVVLPVTVTDKQGRFITDVARNRFVVFDNGRQIPIDLFTDQDAPVTIGLIIDASGSMRMKMGEVVAASVAFAKTSNPEDELFALQFNDDVRDALPERKLLLAADVDALGASIRAIKPDGQTALYDALIEGLDRLASGSRARKVLVVISDGGDNASAATLDQVLARARKSSAEIYTIGLFDDADEDSNPRVLKSLAQATGGERFLPRSPGELLTVCERIAHEIRSGYTIGYVPPDHDGVFHRVRVAMQPAAKNLTLRTRPGYFAAPRATP